MTGAYDDIILLPHPTSARHPRMSMRDRAAQFSPFAALTGYEDAIRETGRLTDHRVTLDEDARQEQDRRQQLLTAALPHRPAVSITYFLPDALKAGGEYVTVQGILKKVDPQGQFLLLEDGTAIPCREIISLDSPVFTTAPLEDFAVDGVAGEI